MYWDTLKIMMHGIGAETPAMTHSMALSRSHKFPVLPCLAHVLLAPWRQQMVHRVLFDVPTASHAMLAGVRVAAVVGPILVEVLHDNKRVARHQRSYGRGHEVRCGTGVEDFRCSCLS